MDVTLFIGIPCIIFMLVYPEHFKKLINFTIYLSGAYIFCIIMLSPFNSAIRYPIDPLNFIIPTKATYFGANAFAQPGSFPKEVAAPLSQLCNQLSQRGHRYVGNLQSMINRLYRE